MAITDIQISDELQTGAPSIKYRGNEGPKAPMEMAMADPMLIEEYEKYVYSMQEQGQEPVSFEQFVKEIMSGLAEGGRAGYGLGSIVGKVTRPIKKVLKNDAVKAAVTAAAMYKLGGGEFKPGGMKGFEFGNILPGFKKFLVGAPATRTAGYNMPGMGLYTPGTKGILGAAGKYSIPKLATAGILASSALPLAGVGMGEEETLEMDMPDSQKFDQSYSKMREDIGDAVSSGVKENFTEVLNKYGLTEGVDINRWEDIRKPSAQGGRIGYADAGKVFASQLKPSNSDLGISSLLKDKDFMINLITQLKKEGKSSEEIINQISGMVAEPMAPVTPRKEIKEIREPFYPDRFEIKEIREPFYPDRFEGLKPQLMAEGGLMNLGGMEKDYRNTGGFVDLGAKEKADDVPARLSVNEFVFTADAVRNAGGGDIDQGAKVMENMMKHLEAGGQVSEESQGMAGARDMFEVSERLSEVI